MDCGAKFQQAHDGLGRLSDWIREQPTVPMGASTAFARLDERVQVGAIDENATQRLPLTIPVVSQLKIEGNWRMFCRARDIGSRS